MTFSSKSPRVQIILAVLLFLSVTVLADRFLRGVRLDLTEEGLYTLSDGTKDVLGSFDEPVTLRYYFSRSLATPYPQLLVYGKRVEDMLRAIKAANPEMINLSVIDPEPFSEEEDEAVAAGLKGVPLGDGSTLYMGLKASNALDGEGAIPFFVQEREKFLEYDLVKLLTGLDRSGQKKLGILTSLPMRFGPGGPQALMQGQSQPYVIYEQLSEIFDVQDIPAGFTELPADLDALMIVQPPQLNEDQLYQIDQYVLKGGRTIAFLDPHSEAEKPHEQTNQMSRYMPSPSDLGPLLAAWGVDMPKGKIVGDGAIAQRVQVGSYGPDSVKDYVFWLGLGEGQLATDDIVAGSVSSMTMATAGVLKPVEGASTKIQPLITSSNAAMLYDSLRAVGMPDPDTLLKELEPTGEQYILAARVTGEAKTAYPEKVAEKAAPAADAGVAKGDINVVLVADTDMLDNRFWVQVQQLMGQRMVMPHNGNGSFVLNLTDHIMGSEALIGLRGRGISKRPFDVVNDLRREAEARYLSEEEALQERLTDLESRLAQTESQKPDGATVLSAEQEKEVEQFRAQLLETRKALREVKRSLRSDIERLGSVLTILNVALMPLLVIGFALVRTQMRRRARQKSAS